MGIIDNMIDSALMTFGLKDAIFYKENSDLQERYDALKRLNEEYPNNEDLIDAFHRISKGLEGENEIAYQLKKSNIGMYVLRDIKIKYEDLTAQIDYVIITPVFIYYIECKNLFGNITVNEKGDFIIEYTLKNGKKIKKGIDSPLRQVESQREVFKKIWNSRISTIGKIVHTKNFENYRRVLVVVANKDTILNTEKAPKDIKYKVLRADGLIRQIQYDIEHRNKKTDYVDSKKEMERTAETYLKLSIKENINYYEYYKNKFCTNNIEINDNLKERLMDFRTKRSSEMNIPTYYVFTNEELDKLIEVRPKTIEELTNANILPAIKIKTHGEKIINIINE